MQIEGDNRRLAPGYRVPVWTTSTIRDPSLSDSVMVESLWQETRHTIRGLRRSPAFSLTVLLTLSLGIGANVTMFGVIDRLMFRPYPFLRDPSTVHRVYWQSWDRGTQRTLWDAEYPRYLELQRSTSSFSQVAGFTSRVVAVGSGEAARERTIMAVSASFFDFFDGRPALGRFFTADEDVTPRGADVAVLGYDYWQSELGGRDVRGELLQIGNMRMAIIGVARKGFSGLNDETPPAVYVPITAYGAHADGNTAKTYYHRYNWRWMEIIARRKPGVSVTQATADATRAAVASWNARREFEPDLAPADVARPNAVVSSLRLGAGPVPSIEARTALWVGGVATIVLLIACANVANLLLARALARERETAVRLALGVSRRRLAARSLIESLTLAIGGAALGLLVTYWSGPVIVGLLSGRTVDWVFTDFRTVVIATTLAVTVAVVTAIVPAILSGRGDLARSLRASRGASAHHSRVRSSLLIIQGALSVLLLIGAGLFVKSLDHVRTLTLGYDTQSVLVVTRRLRDTRLDDSARVALRRAMVETATALPGVASAAWTMTLPFSATNSTSLFVDGIDSVARIGRFTYQAATADYFATVGTRIVRGRGFTSDDVGTSQRVAIVSEGAARALWPGRDPIGQCMRVRVDTIPCSTVVGIAEDIVQDDFNAVRRLQFYVPIEQFEPTGGSTLLVRTVGDAAGQREVVREALQRLMPGSAYVTTRPLGEYVDNARRSWRLGATMFGAFGLLALIVAAIGLYGTVAYNVAQRMHEMGVRIALGAQARDVVRLVVGHSVAFAAAGVTLGIGLSLAAARWIQPLLFKQSAIDVVVYFGVSLTIGVVALIASAAPAFRAARADPNRALRSE